MAGVGADVGVNRRRVALGALVCAVLLVLLAVVLVPWQPPGVGAPVRPVRDVFPEADARAGRDLADRLGPWGAVTLVLRPLLLLAGALVLVRRAGARGADVPARTRPRMAVSRDLALAALLLTVASAVLALPAAIRSGRVLRRAGIVTQPWPAWWRDVVVTDLLAAVVMFLVLAGLWWLWARAPRTWPWWAAGLAAAAVVVASFVWPVLVTPLFEHTRPLPDGPLRTRVEVLAEQQGLGHPQILVTDASARTTTYNASVSGFGPSRRIVLYDTLVQHAETDEDVVVAVVAHEMGHAARWDVLRGTLLAAVAVAAAVLLASLALTGTRARGLLTGRSTRPDRTVALAALLVAGTQVAQLAATPPANLVSRRIEARADVYALDTTRDPAAFERLWVEMTHVSRARVDPEPWWRTALYGTHPSAPWRVGQSREWERLHPGAADGR